MVRYEFEIWDETRLVGRYSRSRLARIMRLPTTTTSAAVRSLLRETAQSVAVITARKLLESHAEGIPSGTGAVSSSNFHGATLSSFTSVALEPYPIVAFALRKPSRMASCLKDSPRHGGSHMAINLLSIGQAETAIKFSRPDLHPEPFSDLSYGFTKEGLPILRGILGALSCRLLSCISLDDIPNRDTVEEEENCEGLTSSELFIAKVLDVQYPDDYDGSPKLPLLYYRRQYTTTATQIHEMERNL